MKIKLVISCSLKTRGICSLKEVSYTGINLINDMPERLLLFKTNRHVLLVDSRKAFLMIRSNSDKDKNKEIKIIYFQKSTLIFGFNASPFIFLYVLRHHPHQFPDDLCTQMLKNNFCMNNLCKTGHSPEELHHLFKEAVNR